MSRPPDNPHRRPTVDEFQNALNALSSPIDDVCANATTPRIIIGGDSNLAHADWKKGVVNPGISRDELLMIKMLEDFGNEYFLLQYVVFSTHRDGNILDLVLTNKGSLVHSIGGVEIHIASQNCHNCYLI